ncbi:hypothetical protein CHS0354_006025 [Potamilus streckersoni]|uniref:Uncharacterized protein n=1 Tax=Potamilus streckersoni TaxID=2493646 RepID=A0AAE0S3L3_9BIVA|nr:hypothetical protein CHS0354_006025 [Potamilus streckersoni]
MASGFKQQEHIPDHLPVPVLDDTTSNLPPIATLSINGQVVPIAEQDTSCHGYSLDCDSDQSLTTVLEKRIEDNLHISPQSFRKNVHDQQNCGYVDGPIAHFIFRNQNDMHAVDENGDSLLHTAIIMDSEHDAIDFINMVTNVCMLNLQNNLFQTPLHVAVLTDMLSVVDRLVSRNVRIDLQDHHGNTPLHLACAKGNLKIVSVLLANSFLKETLEIRNADGVTCVHLAALNDHLDVLRILLEKGANVNARESKSGRTVLHFAAETGNVRLLDLLFLCSDVDVNVETYAGTSALELARGHGYVDVIMRRLHNASIADMEQDGSAN